MVSGVPWVSNNMGGCNKREGGCKVFENLISRWGSLLETQE